MPKRNHIPIARPEECQPVGSRIISNAFNPFTEIGIDLVELGRVNPNYFDTTGRNFAELIDGQVAKVYHDVRNDGKGVWISASALFINHGTYAF